jgi:uncharacterized membrane protein YfcA
MLSIFPQFLFLYLLGIFIVRITIGLACLFLSYQFLFKKREKLISKTKEIKSPLNSIYIWIFGIIFILSSFFMTIGFLTQVSCLIISYLLFNLIFIDKENVLGQTKLLYIVLSVVSLNFLFLGPGLFAIDLPI